MWNGVCVSTNIITILKHQKRNTMNNSSKAVVSFIVGAAVGVAVGYFLNSDKKDELVDKLKYQADKLKDKLKKKKAEYDNALEHELA